MLGFSIFFGGTLAVVVLAFWYTARTALEGENGCFLSMHLPTEGKAHPEVRSLFTAYKRTINAFMVTMLLLILGICLIPEWGMIFFFLWFVVLVVGYTWIYKNFVKKMFALKIKCGWSAGDSSDPDFYWKTGCYRNPEDPAWLVAKRTGIGMEFNTARKGLMTAVYGLCGIAVGLFLWFLWIPLIQLQFSEFGLLRVENQIQIDSPMYASSFELDQVSSVELIETELLRGSKTNGMSSGDYSVGHFTDHNYGRGLRYLHNRTASTVLVSLKDGTYVAINQRTEEETEALYRKLMEWTAFESS